MRYLWLLCFFLAQISSTVWAQLPMVDPADSIELNFEEEIELFGNIVVIPESEFHRLLNSNNFKAIGPNGQKKAVKITTKLNSPVAVGIVANLTLNAASKNRTQIVIVALDAKNLGGDYVEVTRYYVAAVKFRNVTFQTWSATLPRIKMSGRTSGFGLGIFAECCTDSEPKCWEDISGPASCPNGPDFDCVNYSNLPEGLVEDLPAAPDSTWIQGEPTALAIYPDRDQLENGATPIVDIPVKPIVCERCKLVNCSNEPQFDPIDSEPNPQDNACGLGDNNPEILPVFSTGRRN